MTFLSAPAQASAPHVNTSAETYHYNDVIVLYFPSLKSSTMEIGMEADDVFPYL